MSNYTWENGTIIIPTVAWAKFKKAFRDAFNQGRTKDFLLAGCLVENTKAANKGKRGVNWSAALGSEANQYDASFDRFGSRRLRYPFATLGTWELSRILVSKEGSLLQPKKKDFGVATNKTLRFQADEGSVVFDEQAHAVTWGVSENNHACETARDTFVGKTLFSLLAGVKWTRGSGGVIVGNDEYNQDDRHEGGGGNYATARFGPLGHRD